MIARVLPKEEWQKVSHLEIATLVDLVRPEDIKIVVVESGEEIVATMSVIRMTHLEGTWVHPDHRNGVRYYVQLSSSRESGARAGFGLARILTTCGTSWNECTPVKCRWTRIYSG